MNWRSTTSGRGDGLLRRTRGVRVVAVRNGDEGCNEAEGSQGQKTPSDAFSGRRKLTLPLVRLSQLIPPASPRPRRPR